MFSLSANDLELASNLTWYNLCIVEEGFSVDGYHKFVRLSLSEEQRQNIKTIVYSSIFIFDPQKAAQRISSRKSASGGEKIRILPQKSILSRLISFIRHQARRIYYPLPLKNGDFDFDKYVCPDANPVPIKINITPTQITTIARCIKINIEKIHESFPNARIVIVFPSIYSSTDYPDYLFNTIAVAVGNLQSGSKFEFRHKLDFILQPFYPQRDYICDSSHHANKIGREWRTADLCGQIKRLDSAMEPVDVKN